MDIARINTSHSDASEVSRLVKKIRKISSENNKNIAIILDLQGPKIRIGELKGNIELKSGQNIVFTTSKKAKLLKGYNDPIIEPVNVPIIVPLITNLSSLLSVIIL